MISEVDTTITPGRLIWITGLAGAGKTTIGRRIYAYLRRQKPNVVFLDGDELRTVLGGSAGYSRAERLALAMTYCRLCKTLCAQGLEVVCATVSLFWECHKWNRNNFPRYFEIYVQASLETLITRDHKQLYSRALQGELRNVVGIDLEFEPPAEPDLVVRNDGSSDNIDSLVDAVCALLERHKMDTP